MNTGTKIGLLFPHMADKWTGGSAIHKSRAFQITFKASSQSAIIALIKQSGFAALLLERLEEWFPETQWLMDASEFEKLFITDMAMHLEGQGNAPSIGKLVNPATKNEFHRVGMRPDDDLLIGYRIWKSTFKDAQGIVQHAGEDDGPPMDEEEAEKKALEGVTQETILGSYSFGVRVRIAAAGESFTKARQHIEMALDEASALYHKVTMDIPEPTVEMTEKLAARVLIET